jgi:predicted acylesterase/phospholipase RssA
MTIKHLVISGGGPTMIQSLAAIEYLENKNFINMKEIETIYGTSAGAIVAVLICLKYDWETINDYIIKRPWQDVFPIKAQNILDSYTKKGLFDIKTIEKCFKPLLDAKDLSLEITLEEFFNFSKIEIHFFTFEINEFKLEDISYLNYPKLSLLVAIQMTCGLPVLVTPVCLEGKCYVDGGIVCNYSLKYCVESGKKEDEILGLKNKYDKDNSLIDDKSNMMDFIMTFLFKTISSLNLDHIQPNIKNELVFNTSFLTIDVLKNALVNIEFRKELFKSGEETAKKFLETISLVENRI